ncbi:single-stranded DNA-binding protein [Cyanobium sp. Morenito 9A2]|uniref:single-stranded DNA-binding protein n=1 Tax=Cyanobium sp. Morenito 9A2 TaxID=2823718 RepID=UPI0020CD924A|nr:single-stranded DNA-binding protein [Cyanobium sp. Morenito 9A2]MCP9849343.1 single-stranded DNA-binding protein [Cyanobium sp. Morenito 9A2]
MNHAVLEVEVLEAPQLRYTQDNQTPIAEVAVQIDGLRPEDPPGQLKLVGWGNLAQDLQNRVQPGQRLVVEGRLRMNSFTRQDGIKEKRAEFTLSRLHPIAAAASGAANPGWAPSGSQPAESGYPPAGGAPSRQRQGAAPAPVRLGGVSPDGPTGTPNPAQQPALVPPVPMPAAAPVWNTSPLVPDFPEDEDDIPF